MTFHSKLWQNLSDELKEPSGNRVSVIYANKNWNRIIKIWKISKDIFPIEEKLLDGCKAAFARNIRSCYQQLSKEHVFLLLFRLLSAPNK